MTKRKDASELRSAIESVLRDAGRNILLPAFVRGRNQAAIKADGSIVTETDTACQDFIRDRLRELVPGIPLLGEEMGEQRQRECLDRDEYWCLDPLDGTGNFAAGFPCFALSLALMRRGAPHLACIHDPIRNETFSAELDAGAWINGKPLSKQPDRSLNESIGFIDFKRLEAGLAARLVRNQGWRSQRNIGSCTLEWAWLAAGRARFIIHGGEKIWDFAAGALIACEAGCLVTNFQGRGLFDRPALQHPVLAAASPTLHRGLLALVQGRAP
jgi:myo-inositol-1(or 4)-monophosphatase